MKYVLSVEQSIQGRDFVVDLFVWTDPIETNPSYARIAITGPSDKPFLVWFSNKTYEGIVNTNPIVPFFAYWENAASGYFVDPLEKSAGEISMSRYNAVYNFENFTTTYTQNSNITTFDVDNKTYIVFERSPTTSDSEDWSFDLTSLLDPFEVCFFVGIEGNDFVQSNYLQRDCIEPQINEDSSFLNEERVIGNYGLRTFWINEAIDMTLYLEYDPFTFVYQGYIEKPKDSWLVIGDYYETNATDSQSQTWPYSTYFNVDGASPEAGFIEVEHQTPNDPSKISSGDAAKWQRSVVDLGQNNMHRITFNVTEEESNSAIADLDALNSGWDTVRFLTTRQMSFNMYYGLGTTTSFLDGDFENGVFAQGEVFVDIVTAAPTAAPTFSPSRAPTLAPTTSPTRAPTDAPTRSPTDAPTDMPSLAPTQNPTTSPSKAPSQPPTAAPSLNPTYSPSTSPSLAPSFSPTSNPSDAPSLSPTNAPTSNGFLCQTFCSLTAPSNDVEFGYVQTINTEQSKQTFDAATCEEADAATLDQTVDADSICSKCCVSIAGFAEYERWQLLLDINENIAAVRSALGSFLSSTTTSERRRALLSDGASDFITALTYAEADAVGADERCTDIPYPRICRYEAIENEFFVSFGFDEGNDTIPFSLCYADQFSFFGIGFGAQQWIGDGLFYSDGVVADYTLKNQSAAGIAVDAIDNVLEFDTSTSGNEFCVEFERKFDTLDSSDAVFEGNETSVNIWYAVGATLNGSSSNNGYASLPIVPSPEDSDTFWCDGSANFPCTVIDFGDGSQCGSDGIKQNAPAIVDDFVIVFVLNCFTQRVSVNITYNAYSSNWFGIVFSDNMFGDAIIYTTGKSGDRDLSLYGYSLTGKQSDGSGVSYQASIEWTEVSKTEEANSINIVYETDFGIYDALDPTVDSIGFRWAVGFDNDHALSYHTARGDYAEINLETGAVVITEDDDSLKWIHGTLMFVAWSFLCPVSIMSAAFKYLYNGKSKDKWFKIHRYVNGAVLVLTLCSFGIAIYFTEDGGMPHFADTHQQIGLAVTVLCVFQPLNALIRPPSTQRGQKKETNRLIWEIVHKLSGYTAWILSQVAISAGVWMLSGDDLAQYGVLGWTGLIILVYVILWAIKCRKFGAASTDISNVKQAIDDEEVGGDVQFTTTAQPNKEQTFVDEDDEKAPTTGTIR